MYTRKAKKLILYLTVAWNLMYKQISFVEDMVPPHAKIRDSNIFMISCNLRHKLAFI